HRTVPIDVPTPTFQRAPGESSGQFALESAIDELAFAAKIDPLEFRLRNYAERDLEDNKPFSSKSLRDCYHKAAERFGWARRDATPRSMREGHELVGYGMATATYPARQWPTVHVRVKLRPDGTALVRCASTMSSDACASRAWSARSAAERSSMRSWRPASSWAAWCGRSALRSWSTRFATAGPRATSRAISSTTTCRSTPTCRRST